MRCVFNVDNALKYVLVLLAVSQMGLGVAHGMAFQLATNGESCTPLSTPSENNDVVLPQQNLTEEQIVQDGVFPPIPSRFHLDAEKSPWRNLLLQHVAVFSEQAEPQIPTPGLLKKIRSDVNKLMETEGYFSAQIRFEKDASRPNSLVVHVQPGAVVKVKQVTFQWQGELSALTQQPEAQSRRDSSVSSWQLTAGKPFRDEAWRDAKNQLIDQLRADRYAAAKLSTSDALIDVDQQLADLNLTVDSGPSFRLGELHITGLQRYPVWLLERFNPPKVGETYSRARLFEYQRALQNSAYFSAVAVNVDPDIAQADAVPIEVTITERQAREIGTGIGYSTNTGLRTELSYRDRNLFRQAWDLRSAVRIEQKRQLAYSDIYLPPRASNQLDSFGGLVDRLDVAGLLQTRYALGVKRTISDGKWERRFGVNLTREQLALNGAAQEHNQALVASFGATWRQVDNNFFPRDGQIAQLESAISDKLLISDQRFLRLDLKYQRWIPVAKQDHVLLRAEIGEVFAPNPPGSDGIPEDYLFRTGGSTSVRGYAYQSLGVVHPGGVTGGRVLGVASAEYEHQLNDTWGAATFIDIGDAARSWRDFQSKQGLGIGARYRTPAGPIALDLAYGRQVRRLRLDFSISVAF